MANNVVEEVSVDYPDPLDCSTNASICNIGEILPRSHKCIDMKYWRNSTGSQNMECYNFYVK
ncbi:hypothetical protein RYX36_006263 [Vicia faba]